MEWCGDEVEWCLDRDEIGRNYTKRHLLIIVKVKYLHKKSIFIMLINICNKQLLPYII